MALRGGGYRKASEDIELEARLKQAAIDQLLEKLDAEVDKKTAEEEMMDKVDKEAEAKKRSGQEGFSEEEPNCAEDQILDVQTREVDDKMWEAAEDCNLAALQQAAEAGADMTLGDPYCDKFTALHFFYI
jgi:hypothetical protein